MALTALLAASALVAPVGGPIDATGSHLAYSRPEGKSYRLVIDGRDAPVEPRAEPFDVDLGTDARGGLVAVYTRGGDVLSLDVAAGRERRVPAAARRDRSEAAPSVSRGRVAFTVRRSGRERLFVGSLRGSAIRALPDVRQPGCAERCSTLEIFEIELAGRVVAFTTEEGDTENGSTQVRFARLDREPRIVARAGLSVNQRTTFLGPHVSSQWVTVGVEAVGEASSRTGLLRVAPATGRTERADVADLRTDPQAAGRALLGFGLGRDGAFASSCVDPFEVADDSPPACRIVRETPRWRAVGRRG